MRKNGEGAKKDWRAIRSQCKSDQRWEGILLVHKSKDDLQGYQGVSEPDSQELSLSPRQGLPYYPHPTQLFAGSSL